MKPKIFENKIKLQEMLEYYTYCRCIAQVARKYNCDRSSILYQITKAGLKKSDYIKRYEIGTGRPIRKEVEKKVRLREGYCTICEMKLSSPNHTPCQ